MDYNSDEGRTFFCEKNIKILVKQMKEFILNFKNRFYGKIFSIFLGSVKYCNDSLFIPIQIQKNTFTVLYLFSFSSNSLFS